MTATQLYETDPEFVAMIARWRIDKRAPLCLPDFLLEKGLEGQAECAEWCVQEPDRRWFCKDEFIGKAGPFPGRFNEGEWFWTSESVGSADSDHVPHACVKMVYRLSGNTRGFFTCPETALLALLDGWAESLVTGANLPKPLSSPTTYMIFKSLSAALYRLLDTYPGDSLCGLESGGSCSTVSTEPSSLPE